MAYRWLRNPLVLILIPVMLTLVFLIACGGEATTAPEPTQAMMAPVPTPTPVDLSGITSEMQKVHSRCNGRDRKSRDSLRGRNTEARPGCGSSGGGQCGG